MANKYLKFEYWNTCDLGNIYYQGGQHFIFYLDADVGEPLHEEVEEGQENGDGDFIPTYRRQMKRYRIRTGLIPDYLIDAIQRMKLHDTIELTFKSGEVEQIYNVDVEPEWQFEKYAWQGTVTLTFDMDESITVGACCDNLVVQTGGGEPDPEPIPDLYWVAETGNDVSGDGTYANPWATLAYATSQVTTPGDIIHVKAGTITETEQIVLAVGVSIVGQGITSILKLNYVSAGSTDAAIMLTSPAGASVDGEQSISYLLIDGNNLTCTRGIYVAYRNNVVIHNCTIKDISYHGIIFNGTTQGWTVEPTNTSSGNRVHHCILNNIAGVTGPAVGTEGGVRIMGQTGFEFDNNQSIQDSRVSGENADNIKGYANKGMKVHDNYFQRRDVEAWWNFYSEFHYSWGGFEVYNNTFVGGGTWDASGNVKGSYDFGLKIYRNSFTTTTGAAVARGDHRQPSIDIESFTYSNDIYIFNNIFTCVDVPIILENSASGINDVYIYYNLMIECENLTDAYSSPIILDTTLVNTVINDVFIYNNVMTGGSSAFAGVSLNVGDDMNNIVIRNNIFQGPDMNYPVRINAPTPTGYVDYFTFTNNISYGCTSNVASISSSVTVTNDTVDAPINDDPLFVSSSDFHLQSGSPAIGAGVDVGLLTDYDNRTVGNPPEIGAYEY